MFRLIQPRAKNLVMGFATNQSEKSLRIFCQSLRRVYRADECDVAIITNRYEPHFDELARLDVHFVSTTNTYFGDTSRMSRAPRRLVLDAFRLLKRIKGDGWLSEIAQAYPVLLETWTYPHLARWFAYRRVLSLNQFYRQVLLADVKDVVFQARFFENSPEEKVCLFADVNLYGNCYWNDRWYKEGYGKAAFARIVGRQPVCVGTMLGTQQAVLGMLGEFTAFMARSPRWRVEQAMFNHMLHTNGFRTKLETIPNISGAVATLGSDAAHESVRIVDGAIRRVNDGSVIPIVHMYDRWPDTEEWCTDKYIMSPLPGLERSAV